MTLATARDASDIIHDLHSTLGEASAAPRFTLLAYGESVPDGLGAVSPAWLDGNVEAAFAFISEKPSSGHKVRVRRGSADNTGMETSVVEILNDDMPFLVDSVMGELQA